METGAEIKEAIRLTDRVNRISVSPTMAVAAQAEMLKARGVEGEVVGSFVVDTTGRVETSTFRILNSTDSLFSAAVRAALPAMKFVPARLAGAKVRQLVQQAYPFKLPH